MFVLITQGPTGEIGLQGPIGLQGIKVRKFSCLLFKFSLRSTKKMCCLQEITKTNILKAEFEQKMHLV